VDSSFAKAAAARRGCVVVFAGSDSDRPHVGRITESLEEYGIPCEVRICSAHKEPERLMRLLREYEGLGTAVAYIAVAGGTDALSGTLSFHALAPVVSCPPDAPNPSCLSNPAGSSNAVIYNPKNAGRFVAQLFAASNPEVAERLRRSRDEKVRALEASDRERR
jgi:phosphoribosylaminoimidazole carboxylase PurE protein